MMSKADVSDNQVSISTMPESWSSAAIGDLCLLFNGRAFKQTEWKEDGLPIIRIQNLNNSNASFNYYQGELDEKHRIRKGDLLFAWSGTPGTSFGTHEWSGKDAALNQHIFKIKISEDKIERRFFRHAIDQKLDELIGSANGGVGLRHVTKGTFEKTIVAFPPLAEQKAIAQKLDTLLAQVETTKARLDRIPDMLKRFRQSVLAAAVSGKLTEEFRGSDFGGSHQLHTVKSLITTLDQGWSPKCTNIEVEDDEWGVIKTSAVQAGYFVSSENKKLPMDMEPRQRLAISKGDILITRAGPRARCGITCLVKDDFPNLLISDKIYRIRVRPEVMLPSFLSICLNAPQYLKEIEKLKTGTSENGLNMTQEKLNNLYLRVPSLEKQNEIVKKVDTLFAHLDKVKIQVHAAQERVNSLTQSILAKAFRGELTAEWRTANPDLISGDNSAEALLAKIKTEREALMPKRKTGKKA